MLWRDDPLYCDPGLTARRRSPVQREAVDRAGAESHSPDGRHGFLRCTRKEAADRVFARIDADVDTQAGLAYGACRLPNEAGLIFKVLGRETAQVKAKVREFWEVAREEVTGSALRPAFFWR